MKRRGGAAGLDRCGVVQAARRNATEDGTAWWDPSGELGDIGLRQGLASGMVQATAMARQPAVAHGWHMAWHSPACRWLDACCGMPLSTPCWMEVFG
ncbi:hypothetical protein E2562_018251 [Oryza meyeriana var. granulata]|uniref:Uncharacterized protein n=1 Tax=Oryza meyeriana var. granulata TaxID=110450 RepID=A0A6G1CGS2_9ORYZ|nr:hypothetical protein E2562_018251 [Oryza meyeriana var. granulata]